MLETIKLLFSLADRVCGDKSREKRLRVEFTCVCDRDAIPHAALIFANMSDSAETVKELFVETGLVRRKKFSVFVRWGFPNLPQVIHPIAQSPQKVTMPLAEHGSIEATLNARFIRFGCITTMYDIFYGRFLRDWEKVKLREIIRLHNKS